MSLYCVAQPPMVSGTNHDVVIGPYNTHYAKLEAHLAKAGVNPLLNRWDVFVSLWPMAQPMSPGADDGTFRFCMRWVVL